MLERSLLKIDFWFFINQIYNDFAKFERLQGLFCILVNQIVRLNQFKFFELILKLQLVYPRKKFNSIHNFI